MTAPPAAALSGALRQAFPEGPPARLGIALSGGGDSVALAVLLGEWARAAGCRLSAATVDHGLRPEAAAEVGAAAQLSAALGIGHTVLRWQGGAGRGNLPDRARRARYALLAEWAGTVGAGHVVLGHTEDDQAETVLLRLARGAGVDGLSGMAPVRVGRGVTWLRPLLGVSRAALRAELRARGVGWSEDPTNDDPRFDRVRARQALAGLSGLGVGAPGLAATAARLREARAALDDLARRAAGELCRQDGGDLLIDAAGLGRWPAETRRRLLAAALGWISGAGYPPRAAALAGALDAVGAGTPHTLQGCLILPQGGTVRLCREHAAVAACSAPPGGLWDGRWRLSGPLPAGSGAVVQALGDAGLSQLREPRATGRPRAALRATPAVWHGDRLCAAPLAGMASGWRAELAGDRSDFAVWLDSR